MEGKLQGVPETMLIHVKFPVSLFVEAYKLSRSQVTELLDDF